MILIHSVGPVFDDLMQYRLVSVGVSDGSVGLNVNKAL